MKHQQNKTPNLTFAEDFLRQMKAKSAKNQFMLLAAPLLLTACFSGESINSIMGSTANPTMNPTTNPPPNPPPNPPMNPAVPDDNPSMPDEMQPNFINTPTATSRTDGGGFVADLTPSASASPSETPFSIVGNGYVNELQLRGEGTIDLNAYTKNMESIELINTETDGNIGVQLSAADVIAISDFTVRGILPSNLELLILHGELDEVVTLTDSGWINLSGIGDSGVLKHAGAEYNFWRNGNALLAVEENRPIIADGEELDNSPTMFNLKNRHVLFGTEGNDRLEGGRGNEYLYGGKGDDILITGDGSHTLVGGSGKDIFVLDSHADEDDDLILDFEQGIDKISLSNLYRQIPAYFEQQFGTIPDSDIDAFIADITTAAFMENTPVDFFREFFLQGAWTAEVIPEALFANNADVMALQLISKAGTYSNIGITYLGDTYREDVPSTHEAELLIIPTEEFANIGALNDAITGGNASDIFDQVIMAIGGADALIYF